MLCRADSIGVFQVESRAQMNFLPRMRPRNFYDLVIEVAIVRPGPIQGDMVHPYIRRRNGEEPVTFPLRCAGGGAGQDPRRAAVSGAGDADRHRWRRASRRSRRTGCVVRWRPSRNTATSANSAACSCAAWRRTAMTTDFSERCFSQIEGFGSYGFPESHAASFALLVYASAWIKCHHPGIFACALLECAADGVFTRPRRSCGMPASMAWRCAPGLHQQLLLGQRDGARRPRRPDAAAGVPADQGPAG